MTAGAGAPQSGPPSVVPSVVPSGPPLVAPSGPSVAPVVRRAQVVLFALGGTISMAGHEGGGVVARLSGRDLLGSATAQAGPAKAGPAKAGPAKADTAKADTAKADTAKADTAKADTAKADTAKADTAKADTAAGGTAPGATAVAGAGGIDVDVRDVPAVPSANLSFRDILDVVDAASEAVAGGARGIVVTQGTDTLEETAFLVDSVWPHDTPFVLTGAMRNPTLPGADGPANLAAALAVAASAGARGRGALVVFNDDIHAARHVRKTHSTSTAAFVSPDAGPLGHLVEAVPRFLTQVPRRRPVTGFSPDSVAATRIALHTMTLDDDGALLDGIARTHHGLVVAGFGVGHVPASLAPVLGDIAATVPVVLTSRTGAGTVLAATYGAVGSERDLRERGLIGGGYVHPYQARVLLRLLVAGGAPRTVIAEAFADLG